MKKYKGKYRNESRRLNGWDYSRDGYYFLTIMTYNRTCLFGDIKNGKMILNDFGKIATDEWFRSFEMRDELVADEFILIPNHLHAIVGLETVGTGMVGTEMVGTTENVGSHGPENPNHSQHSNANQNQFRHSLRGINRWY